MNEITDYSQKASWYIQGKKRTMKRMRMSPMPAPYTINQWGDDRKAKKMAELTDEVEVAVVLNHPEKESERKILDWERTYFLTKYYCI